MPPKQARVVEFFRAEIGTFVMRDLASLRVVKSLPMNSDTIGWCAAPLAQTLFAVLDLLGYLVRPEEGAKKTDTLKNINAVLSDSALFSIEYRNHADVLVKQYRHGLIHQFFPKAAGIARLGEDGPLFVAGPCLNVDRLEKDSIVAIQKLASLIRSHAYESLCEQIFDRLDLLASEDWETFPTTT